MRNRIASILLALCLALSLLPSVVFAQETVGQAATEAELTAALADSANEAVRLTADITITVGLKIQHNVTVDLNGHILRYDETAEPDSIFRVTGGKTLTMTDSRPAATHEDAKLPAGGLITGGRGYRYDGGAGQTYIYYGGGVYVEAGASFELAGGTIYACGVQSGAYQAFGGGIYADGGSVTMTGGAIRNCALSTDSSSCGGGVYIYSLTSTASFTMEGGVISGCSAKYGGGILTSGCTVQITGGRIENCTASERGGGLYIGGHADQISVLDAVISGCEAKRGGGVALMGFAELELGENARITGCKAAEKDDTEAGTVEYGAAVYMDLDSTYTVNYPGCFLYANGGRVEGTVYVGRNGCDQEAEIKATNAIDHTDGKPSTVFTGDVYCAGDIRGGSFYGSVTATIPYYLDFDECKNFWSNLSGGSFYGPVRTEGYVSGGTYYAGLTLEKNAKLSGKPIQTTGKPGPTTNIPDPNGVPVTVTYAYGALGGTYATQIVQAGETAIRPDDPTKTGYTFAGWYLGPDAYDFTGTVRANLTLTAKWTVCDHTGSTAKPTCTGAVSCTLCGETLPATGHSYVWRSGDGMYWQQCGVCSQETAKNAIPQLVINGADRVCRTQDYTFTFALPQGCRNPTYGYDFMGMMGDGGLAPALKDGVYSATITTASYYTATGFQVMATAKTEDGFAFTVTKDIAIVDGHTGGVATCVKMAVCEVCGESYGEADSGNHPGLACVAAKAATTEAEGNIEYWHCADCGKYFRDAAAGQEITLADTVTAKLPQTPQTGDNSNLMLWIALLFVSGGAATGTTVVIRRKKLNR